MQPVREHSAREHNTTEHSLAIDSIGLDRIQSLSSMGNLGVGFDSVEEDFGIMLESSRLRLVGKGDLG